LVCAQPFKSKFLRATELDPGEMNAWPGRGVAKGIFQSDPVKGIGQLGADFSHALPAGPGVRKSVRVESGGHKREQARVRATSFEDL